MMEQKFIPGIYNYCDRWCERCTFTTRCRNFESIDKLSSDQLDMNNAAFWNTISSNLSNAVSLLEKAAAKHGIDIHKSMTEEETSAYKKRETFINNAAKNHPLAMLCRQYQKIAMPFTEESEGLVDKTRALVSELHMGIKTEEETIYTIADIGDCFEIIGWYLFFMDAKLQRALHGKLEDDNDEKDYQSDSNGSAKIAIIAIERSMNAWIKLYELMPSSEDVALNALALLSRIKQTAINEFPVAMQFIRPGFDE